ncbi:RcnB family protein, partial [Blastomonas sp.]|uniref:RcnB family protein n=1 Tax=Blastomonas sp. TaxID=1909299 RepID=UPI00359383A7
MTTRRKAYLRHLALAATAGCIAVTVTTASAAESPLTASAGLDQTIFLQSGRVMTTSVGRQLPVGAPAYVRPFRGFFLPRVWIAPRYYINNWQAYGLPQPAQGYGWSRYYDDAVLTDRQGMVQDSVQAMNWSAAQSGQQIASAQPARQVYSPDYDPYNYDTDLLLGNDQVVAGTHWSSTYADPQPGFDDDPSYPVSAPPPPPVYADNYWDEPAFLEACRRDSGLGGAAIGAAVGGLAGNRIAGRG